MSKTTARIKLKFVGTTAVTLTVHEVLTVKGLSAEIVSLQFSQKSVGYSSSSRTPVCSRDLPPGSCHVTPRRVTYRRLRTHSHPVHNSSVTVPSLCAVYTRCLCAIRVSCSRAVKISEKVYVPPAQPMFRSELP